MGVGEVGGTRRTVSRHLQPSAAVRTGRRNRVEIDVARPAATPSPRDRLVVAGDRARQMLAVPVNGHIDPGLLALPLPVALPLAVVLAPRRVLERDRPSRVRRPATAVAEVGADTRRKHEPAGQQRRDEVHPQDASETATLRRAAGARGAAVHPLAQRVKLERARRHARRGKARRDVAKVLGKLIVVLAHQLLDARATRFLTARASFFLGR